VLVIKTTQELKFSSSDNLFGLKISFKEMEKIRRCCVKNNNKEETGGILVGQYSRRHNDAVVTHISKPPDDSKRGASFFIRGIKGLQQLLNLFWKRKEYYLGEWHYHPFSHPIPSDIDNQQMIAFAQNKLLKCPEPVLLLIGGNPKKEWNIKGFVYFQNGHKIELFMVR
jgi:integrative and conjugative element protein (TIGR02256 family)